MFIGKFNRDIYFPTTNSDKPQPHILGNNWDHVFSYGLVTIYFAGEIYNKKRLGFSDINNDAQLIADLYTKEGHASFSKLDGSFTFIIYYNEKDLMIVRDHHGTHSQIYYNDKYFASSLALLQNTEGFSKEPNYEALSSFLHIGYIATPTSAFKNVKKLSAGHILNMKNGHKEIIPLFLTDNISPAHSSKDLDTLAYEYSELHKESISQRIKDSHKIGILLSGGYDSGCNLAALRKLYNGEIYSYSIGFKGDNWTELPLARCMSQKFHTNHKEYEIDGSEITSLPEIVDYLGDPFVEGGLMVNYAAMRMIGDNKPDVILGGDGSDQYFGTSGREIALHYLSAKYGVKPLLKIIYHILNNNSFDKNTKLYRIRFHLDKILNILEGDLFGFSRPHLKALLQNKSYLPPSSSLSPDLRSFEHLYTQHLYKSDIDKIINQVILFKASKIASMYNNHIVFPYMDHTLYQFLMELPVEYKCRGNTLKDIAQGQATAKFLLKYHYKKILPPEITAKKKQGGFAPMPLFFKNPTQRNRIAEFILSSSIIKDFLKQEEVEKFIRTYENEVDKNGYWFWYQQNKAIQYFHLLTLAIWWEKYIYGRTTSL